MLQHAAQRALSYCKTQYGSRGLKLEEGIHGSISWRPTFLIKPNKFEIFAFEVNDVILPDAIKGASHDIRHFNQLIRVFQVCPLEVYQADRQQKRINPLRAQGFGMITVSSDGSVIEQFPCIPLAQFVTSEELENAIKPLPSSIKVRLREAHKIYLTNAVKGVQDACEVLEGLLTSVAKQSARSANVTQASLGKTAAFLIDELYSNSFYKDHRATLGGVRSILKLYRNPTSHAPKTAQEAAQRAKDSKAGFVETSRQIVLLGEMAKRLGLVTKIYF